MAVPVFDRTCPWIPDFAGMTKAFQAPVCVREAARRRMLQQVQHDGAAATALELSP
jgi:hypothetical protein